MISHYPGYIFVIFLLKPRKAVFREDSAQGLFIVKRE